MNRRRSTPALRVVLLMACAAVLLGPGVAPPAPGAAGAVGTAAAEAGHQPPVARLIRAALVAGDRGAPLPRPLVNESGLHNDVWQRWWLCTLDWDAHRGPICALGDKQAERVVVVYGDSHAGMWLPALDQMGLSDEFRVVPLIKFGCGPFDVVQRHDGKPLPSCPRFRRWAEHKIATIDPALIVLGYRGFLAVDPKPGQTIAEAWQRGTRTALHRIVKLAPRVVTVGDVPGRGQRPRQCLADPDADLGTCTTRVEAAVNQANLITRRAARAAHSSFVTTQNLVCADGRCPLVVDRIITYRDASHLSMTWTHRITAQLHARIHPERGR